MSMKLRCLKCNGTGRAELPLRLRLCRDAVASLRAAKVSTIAKELNAEITATHHLIRRLVVEELVERVPESSPAQYRLRR